MFLSNCLTYYIESWKKCFVFAGRVNREKFWCFQLINILITTIFINLTEMKLGKIENIITSGKLNGLACITVIFLFASIFPQLSMLVKRLHDTGKTGWFAIIYFIPIINIFILIFLIRKGDPNPNEYGANTDSVE